MDSEYDEEAAMRHVVERLRESFPSVDPVIMDAAVTVARRRLREARIRAYVAILVERHARATLAELVETEAPARPPFALCCQGEHARRPVRRCRHLPMVGRRG